MEFDLETLSPTYRVSIGLPGTSHAFQIAERLGLPTAIVDDARSRLTEGQVAFEETLASIRRHEGEAVDALARARAAESRAAEARRQADEERRRARVERDDAVKAARLETERIVSSLRDEVRAARKRLEREALTTSALDRIERTADEHLAQLPATEEAVPEPEAPADVAWRVGMRARSRTRGWDGRIAALDRGGRRATLEVGGMRVTVETEDLVPAGAAPEPARPARRTDAESSSGSIPLLRLDRARTVASSLDLRGARVEEALEMLGRYLDDAALAGLERATVVHGLGTGALRDAVRGSVAASPLVRTWRPGARGEGGDGATIVEF